MEELLTYILAKPLLLTFLMGAVAFVAFLMLLHLRVQRPFRPGFRLLSRLKSNSDLLRYHQSEEN